MRNRIGKAHTVELELGRKRRFGFRFHVHDQAFAAAFGKSQSDGICQTSACFIVHFLRNDAIDYQENRFFAIQIGRFQIFEVHHFMIQQQTTVALIAQKRQTAFFAVFL